MKNILVAVIAALALCSCAALRPLRGIPTQHIVMIESNGRIIDPTGAMMCHEDSILADNAAWVAKHGTAAPPSSYSWHPCNGRLNPLWTRELERKKTRDKDSPLILETDAYLSDLFTEMDRYYASHPAKTRKIVIFIHGGLNNNSSTIARARDTAQLMLDDGYYPIFLNWQSNLVGSLWEHLMNVRQGDHKGYKHFYLFPAYLGADLAKGIVRAPATWFYQASSGIDRNRHVLRRKQDLLEYDENYCRLRAAYVARCLDESGNAKPCDELAVSKGPETHRWPERIRAGVRFTATGLIPIRYWAKLLGGGWASPVGYLPAKPLVSPFLDGLGGPAWDTMLRHAALGFHSNGVQNPVVMPPPRYPEGNGGFSRFFRALRQKMRETDGAWELTIIGHSMGAIVLNHTLEEFGDIHFDNIVYMAAAASVRDYERAVFPYLQKPEHKTTKMYHLTLHDFAELRDQYAFDIAPAGSLLVWIDSFLAKPETFRDRTAGRWSNLMMFAEETPAELKSRISIKSFGVGESILRSDPQHHGDFNDFDGKHHRERFWSPSFWTVENKDRVPFCPAGIAPARADWVERTLASLTVDEKIGQMLMAPGIEGRFRSSDSDEWKQVERDIVEFHAGSYHVEEGDAAATAVMLNDLQRLAKVPLLMAHNLEGGAGFVIDGATRVPLAMAIGATGDERLAYSAAQLTAREGRALGIHVNFYPVADVNNNPDNPIINIRSFGEDPARVSRFVAAYVRGIEDNGMIATAKHFPGHGDVAVDSHLELPVLDVTRQRLDAVELPPFRAAIDAGVGAVMTAHIWLPQLEPEKNLPSTLSKRVITDLLRKDLGFRGIVFTDAMRMGAVRSAFTNGEAAVRAVEAGADILVGSPSVPDSFRAIRAAVQGGRITEARLDESVRRILAAKRKLELHKDRFVDVAALSKIVGTAENRAIAQEIADHAITIVKNEDHVLPISPSSRVLQVNLFDRRQRNEGEILAAELSKHFPRSSTVDDYDRARKIAKQSDTIIINSFIHVIDSSGSISLNGDQMSLVRDLIATKKPVVFIAFGSPYVLRHVDAPAQVATYDTCPVMEVAAMKVIAGAAAVTGPPPPAADARSPSQPRE